MHKFQVFIMPSKSENFGHALLEALSAGKPVITTDTTPFKELQQVKAGYTVSANHLAEELPQAIRFFAAMQEEEFAAYTAGAATYARAFLATERLQQQYQHLFTTA
jgi:glycosyltransferase involved in cell wall biosynthesis